MSAQFLACFQLNFSDTLLISYGLNFTSEANYGTKKEAITYLTLIAQANLEIPVQMSKTLVSGQI